MRRRSTNTSHCPSSQVLDALQEIAFAPLFLDSRIDKERRAVLSEGQMMNTIEYRVDCQLLSHLHWENALGCRFPIGLAEQIEKWPRSTLTGFHSKWRACIPVPFPTPTLSASKSPLSVPACRRARCGAHCRREGLQKAVPVFNLMTHFQ